MISQRKFCNRHKIHYHGLMCRVCVKEDSADFSKEDQLRSKLHEHISAMFKLPDIGNWTLETIYKEIINSGEAQALLNLYSTKEGKGISEFVIKDIFNQHIKMWVDAKV